MACAGSRWGGEKFRNRLIKQVLGWSPTLDLREGLRSTYNWIFAQVNSTRPQRDRGRSCSSLDFDAALQSGMSQPVSNV